MTISLGRGRLAAAGLCALMASQGALAADPSEGTLTLESGPIEFSSGPNVGVNVTPQVEATCMDVLLPCDHFDLTIDLPEDIGDYFPSALIRMVFSWDDPAGAGAEDYDIYMYDAAGNEVNSAASANNPEVMTQLALGGVFEYSFDIVYFSVLGSTYTGKITLDLGEPAEGVDTEEFFMQNSLLARAWSPVAGDSSESEQESRSASVDRRSAGGALGGGLLVVALAGLLGRRRRPA